MSGKIPAGKEKGIEQMFDTIAPRYDLANSLFSFGTDRLWRKKLVNELRPFKPKMIADIATGTGKLAFLLSKELNAEVYGIDISENMLEIARKKYPSISFIRESGEKVPFPDNSFDAITIAFGIRNFDNPVKGLGEALRILKPEGIIAVLEFSQPSKNLWGRLFRFYFRTLIPFAGRILTGNKNAYSYLNKSALSFTSGSDFLILMQESGFINLKQKRLTGGISTIYTGIRPV